jgi:hypothetical protein
MRLRRNPVHEGEETKMDELIAIVAAVGTPMEAGDLATAQAPTKAS